jgi:hypothetical protein
MAQDILPYFLRVHGVPELFKSATNDNKCSLIMVSFPKTNPSITEILLSTMSLISVILSCNEFAGLRHRMHFLPSGKPQEILFFKKNA